MGLPQSEKDEEALLTLKELPQVHHPEVLLMARVKSQNQLFRCLPS